MMISSLTTTSSTSAVTATSAQGTSDVSTLTDPGAPPELSGLSDVMSQLQELQQSDPDKFKEAMKKIAEKLKAAAGDAGDGFLSELAGKFEKAAETGDLDSVKPKGPPPGGPRRKPEEAYQANAKQGMSPDDIAQLMQQALSEVNGGSSSSAA
ncbi:MAG: hypothetical protein QM767_23565 [Anaeromyxobacter sp.]